MNLSIKEFSPEVGISRDNTAFDTKQFIDGLWTRFYKNRPKKMGGYRVLAQDFSSIIRTELKFQDSGINYIFVGTADGVFMLILNNDGFVINKVDITPLDYVPNEANLWTFGTLFSFYGVQPENSNGSGPALFLIAQVAPRVGNTTNTQPGNMYYVQIDPDAVSLQNLIDLQGDKGQIRSSGGFMIVGTYIVTYQSNGSIDWNNGININSWEIFENPVGATAGGTTIGSENFIQGFPIRSGNTFAALVFSTNALIKLTLSPIGSADSASSFTFIPTYESTISSCISIDCPVSYEPDVFWVGSDSFYRYSGFVDKFPNNTNKLFFFNGLNKANPLAHARSKVTSFINDAYDEWCILFINGDPDKGGDPLTLENNWMLVYQKPSENNGGQGSWYDTPIKRCIGQRATSGFPYPILSSSIPLSNSGYGLYQHEIGVDNIDFTGTRIAIPAYITGLSSSFKGEDPSLNSILIDSVYPDLEQQEDVTLTIQSYAYPRIKTISSSTHLTITPETELLNTEIRGNTFKITFSSNELGGDFLLGACNFGFKKLTQQRPIVGTPVS